MPAYIKTTIVRGVIFCAVVTGIGHASSPADSGEEDTLAQFRDGYPLNSGDTLLRGSATLTIDRARIKRGDDLWAEVIFRVSRDSANGWVFNPFQDALLPRSFVVVMYDSRKKLVSEWGDQLAGSRKGITPGDWAWMGPGNCAGTGMNITPFWPVDRYGKGTVPKAGKYYLQVIYRDAFVGLYYDVKKKKDTVSPFAGDKLIDEFDKSELFRSNAVEVEMTE